MLFLSADSGYSNSNSACHHITESPNQMCGFCGHISNQKVLVKYLRNSINWKTLWGKNPLGGWPCLGGNIQHPFSNRCCCGEQREELLTSMFFHVGKSINRKLRKHNKASIHPLNLEFCCEPLCVVYTAEL